ncbi:MAG: hypothetical protein IT168_22570 [Bryobacterales bacterium]|nr:hypothetical protein [Bryobacterales bacterium]
MTRRTLVQLLATVRPGLSQPPAPKPPGVPADDFTCPMDKEVRQKGPGKCPRCGMKLVADLPKHVDYNLQIATEPRLVKAGVPAAMRFTVRHPATNQTVRDFELIHERIFHLFVISDDLRFFAHEHPEQQLDGSFCLALKLPFVASYRVVADFFPKGGTPQFLTETIFTVGARLKTKPQLVGNVFPQQAKNLKVALTMEPAQPIAGQETLLFFKLDPPEAIEQYLAAWGHMLVASDDLIDIVHDHPLYVDGVAPPDLKAPSPSQVQFNIIFPRASVYRVWVQFQRKGVVNTAAFTVPVRTLG